MNRNFSPLTKKQKKLMRVILAGNKNDTGATVSWCDLGQIMDRVDYTATREAFLCSMRFLKKKGLIESRSRAEVRRGRRRTIYMPTDFAFDLLTRPIEELDEEYTLIGTSK